jgi:hypothetical protein
MATLLRDTNNVPEKYSRVEELPRIASMSE